MSKQTDRDIDASIASCLPKMPYTAHMTDIEADTGLTEEQILIALYRLRSRGIIVRIVKTADGRELGIQPDSFRRAREFAQPWADANMHLMTV